MSDADATMEMQSVGRLERLEQAVSRLRSRGKLDVDRAHLIAGAVLLVLGLLAILLGWHGAANSPYLFEQVPYLISGGLLGLGLVFAGGFVYFAYWVTRLVRDSRDQAARAEEALQRIEQLLEPSPNGQQPARARARGPSRVSKRPSKPFVATPKGTMFHREDCTVVAGQSKLRRVDAQAKGMQPCRLCDPLAPDE